MARLITYKGATIWNTASTGRGWKWTPGVVEHDVETVRLPLGDGALWKDGGSGVAAGELVLLYEVASASAANTLRGTLAALASSTEGALVLPDGVTITGIMKTPAISRNASKTSNGYLVEYTIPFEESA